MVFLFLFFFVEFIIEKNLFLCPIYGTASQVALRWIIQKSPYMIPIFGAKNEKQLHENLGCLTINLSDSQMQFLDSESQIELGFPYEFLQREGIRKMLVGDNIFL